MAREYTVKLIEWSDNTGEWEFLARLCMEWMEEHDVKSMAQHHDILDEDETD